jgi:hypothetical protein
LANRTTTPAHSWLQKKRAAARSDCSRNQRKEVDAKTWYPLKKLCPPCITRHNSGHIRNAAGLPLCRFNPRIPVNVTARSAETTPAAFPTPFSLAIRVPQTYPEYIFPLSSHDHRLVAVVAANAHLTSGNVSGQINH